MLFNFLIYFIQICQSVSSFPNILNNLKQKKIKMGKSETMDIVNCYELKGIQYILTLTKNKKQNSLIKKGLQYKILTLKNDYSNLTLKFVYIFFIFSLIMASVWKLLFFPYSSLYVSFFCLINGNNSRHVMPNSYGK